MCLFCSNCPCSICPYKFKANKTTSVRPNINSCKIVSFSVWNIFDARMDKKVYFYEHRLKSCACFIRQDRKLVDNLYSDNPTNMTDVSITTGQKSFLGGWLNVFSSLFKTENYLETWSVAFFSWIVKPMQQTWNGIPFSYGQSVRRESAVWEDHL